MTLPSVRPETHDHLPAQPHRPARKPGRHDSAARRAFNLAALVARFNRGRVTVASYLTELGADADTIRRYGHVLGRKTAEAFRAEFHAEPVKSGLAVVGRHLARCFAYDAGDIEILRAAVAGYGRVSHLLNGGS